MIKDELHLYKEKRYEKDYSDFDGRCPDVQCHAW